MMETFVPRLRAGVRVHHRDDGSAVLADEAAGHYLEVAVDEARLLALVDGARSVGAIAAEHYHLHRFVPFQALSDLVASIAAHGFWSSSAEELHAAGLELHRAKRPWRWWSFRLVRIPLPAGRATALSLLGLLGVAVAFLLVQGLRRPWVALHGRDALLGPGASPLWGLVLALVGVAAAMGMRSLLRGGVAAWCGAPPRALELRLHCAIPTLELEAGPVHLLGRWQRVAAHAAAGFAPFLVSGCALVGAPLEAGPALALGAGLCGFLDLCPFAPSSLGHVLAAISGQVDLREHARAYLSRKFLSRVGTKHLFEGEGVIVLTSALSTLWCVEALELMAREVPHASLRLLAEAAGHTGLERAAAWLYLALLTGGTLGSLWLTAQIALASLASAFPGVFHRRPAKGAAIETTGPSEPAGLEALQGVPLFAELPPEALAELSRNVSVLRYPPRAVVVRQGDAAQHFYAILEGRMAVHREEASGRERQVAQLGPGDCFGEVALLQHAPCAATVETLSPSTLLGVPRAAFERMVQSLPGLDVTRVIRAAVAVHKNPLLSHAPPACLAGLLPKLVQVSAEPGQRVIERGAEGDAFYLVDDGELEVLDEREQHPIASLKNGDHFGEIALLRNVPRTATVRAVKKTELWVLSREDFFATLGHDLAVSGKLEEQARVRARHLR